MKRLLNHTCLRLTAALIAILACRLAEAHMPWLATDDDKHALFWFGESPDDKTYHMPDRVAAIELKGPGTVETSMVDEDAFVGLRSNHPLKTDDEIAGTVTYGLYHGMKLTYHVEHLPGRDPATWPTAAREDAPLQSVITPAPAGGVMVRVLNDGKPASGLEVKLYCEDGHEEDSQTTDAAGMVTFSKDVVEDGLNAIMVGVTSKDAKGELDGEAYTNAADYLTATFYHGQSNEGGEATGHDKIDKKAAVMIDPSSDTSIQASGLPDLPEELTSFGAAIAGEKLYVYGGHTGNAHSYSVDEQSNRLWCLDLAAGGNGKWEVLTNGPRLQGLALVAHGHDVIRIGGFTAMNEIGDDHDLHSQANVAKYSPATKTWTNLASLPEPRSSLDAAVLGDRVFVFGGWQMQGDPDDNQWHDTAWSLNLGDNNAAWEPIATPPFQRRAISVAAHDGKLFVLGGMQAVGGPTTRVDVYDPSANAWTQGPAIPGSGMSGFGSSSFECEGNLYVSTMDGFLHRLNDDGDAWTTIAKSDPARFFHRLLPHGQEMLMIGGANMEFGKLVQIDKVRLTTLR